MTDTQKAEQRRLVASLSIADQSTSLAWSIAVRCRTPQDELRVRCLPGPGLPGAIGPEEVLLWLAAVAPSRQVITDEDGAFSVEQATEVLNAEEADRLARFLHIEDRLSFLAAHAGARLLLGSIVGRPADTLRFELSTHGKPMLVAGPPDIDFSLSHARGAVAIAAACMPVGVDIEPLRDITDMDAIGEIVLAKEEQEMVRNAPAALRSSLFLRYWTLKEAILKAAGLGFVIPPNTVIVDAGPSPSVVSVPAALGPATQWRLIAPAV